MSDTIAQFSALRRPQVLIRAARHALSLYDRNRDLKRLLSATPAPAVAMPQLMEQEAEAEEIRQTGAASYNLSRHIELLAALMAEAQLVLHPSGV